MTQNSIALRPRQPHSAPGQRQRSSIDRIMVFTETESLSLHCNGLALHAHMQHEAAAQRSAGAARGLWVKGVAFLGGYGHERPRAYNTPPSKKKKQAASTKFQKRFCIPHPGSAQDYCVAPRSARKNIARISG